MAGGFLSRISSQTITNTRWYLAGSNAENGNDRSIAESFRVHQKFFSNLGSKAEFADVSGGLAENGDEFLADLLNKELVHFGVITQICHGSFIRKNDGSFISLYNVYDFVRDNKTMEQAVNDLELQNEQEFLDNFYTEHIEDVAENTGIFVNATSFWISSNLYRHVYQNCFFDNTIIYFGTNTHAGESGVEDWESDVLSHRGDIMGYVVSYYGKGLRWLGETAWGNENTEDSYYVADSTELSSWYPKSPKWMGTVMKWIYDRGDDIQGGFRTFHLKKFSNYEKMRALSYGTLSGKVVTRRTQIFYDTEGNETVNTLEAPPAKQANLTFYQLLDQQFVQREGQGRTGDDGTFTVENLRWGVYGIRVTGNGIVDFETGVTFCDDQFDGGTIEVNPYNASYTGFLMTKGEETDQPVTNTMKRSESLTNGYDYNYTVIYMNAEREKVELMEYLGTDAEKAYESLGSLPLGSNLHGTGIGMCAIEMLVNAYSDFDHEYTEPSCTLDLLGYISQSRTDGWLKTRAIRLSEDCGYDHLDYADYSLYGLSLGMEVEEAEQLLLTDGWSKVSESKKEEWKLRNPTGDREAYSCEYFVKEDKMISWRISAEIPKLFRIEYGDIEFMLDLDYKYRG